MTNFEFCRDSIHSKTTESCLLLFLCTLDFGHAQFVRRRLSVKWFFPDVTVDHQRIRTSNPALARLNWPPCQRAAEIAFPWLRLAPASCADFFFISTIGWDQSSLSLESVALHQCGRQHQTVWERTDSDTVKISFQESQANLHSVPALCSVCEKLTSRQDIDCLLLSAEHHGFSEFSVWGGAEKKTREGAARPCIADSWASNVSAGSKGKSEIWGEMLACC